MSLQHSPRTLSWFKGGLFLREKEGEGRERQGGVGMAPLTQIPGSAPGNSATAGQRYHQMQKLMREISSTVSYTETNTKQVPRSQFVRESAVHG